VKKVSWLHLSDLHVGMKDSDWLWPTLKERFYDDVSYLFDKNGAWDVVIFSGDLTQQGLKAEFDRATQLLLDLWKKFETLGFKPVFLCVPGNHDLCRPLANDPALMLLKDWWSKSIVRDSTLAEGKNIYRSLIEKSFKNYQEWYNSPELLEIRAKCAHSGLLPGDFASEITTETARVSFVGLNSSWLALDAETHDKKLNIDVRQFLGAIGGDVIEWRARSDFRFIVTHHPHSWLHPQAAQQWNSEISPAGRFNLHFCGHMHVPDSSSTSHGGGRSRIEFQSASLLGLERIDSLNIERTHGFALGKLSQDGQSNTLEIWPRRLERLADGSRKFTADQSLGLPNGQEFFTQTDIAGVKLEGNTIIGAGAMLIESVGSDQERQALQKIRHFLPASRAAQNVRRVEQRQALSASDRDRAFWLVAEWGAGSDQFLWAVQRQGGKQASTFRLDLHGYENRDGFLSTLKQDHNFTLQQFSEALSGAGLTYLILDDVPVSSAIIEEGQYAVEADVEEMCRVLLEYCPQLNVVLRTRRLPMVSGFPVVSLKPLDEADLSVYVAEHERGGAQFLDPTTVSQLFRFTDGVPARIDAALRELEVTSIANLSSMNLDVSKVDGRLDQYPKGLVDAVSSFAESDNPSRRRSFDLLKALAAFPQGETVERLKRFYGPHPIFANHARDLLDSSLIATKSSINVTDEPEAAQEKFLVVPRPVRDYVRATEDREALQNINELAANLYFGEKWKEGTLKKASLSKFRHPAVSAEEVTNAGTIIIRLLNDAIQESDERAFRAGIDIADRFLSALVAGDHFRSVVTLCREILTLTKNHPDCDNAGIELAYGKSLRMIGEHEEARDVLLPLCESESMSLRQSAFLNLAMTYQSLKDKEATIETAEATIKIDKTTALALQARAVLLAEDDTNPNAEAELLKLEALCRRKGHNIVANNLALTRVRNQDVDAEEAMKILDLVLKTSKSDQDFYNAARAMIQITRNLQKRRKPLSGREKSQLIQVYQFLFRQRLKSLFDECHEALWQLFESLGETDNLFTLFRHSSLIWRLRGDTQREEQYLRKLAKYAASAAINNVLWLDRGRAYYLVRANANPLAIEHSTP
jgi:tetratricopeptide (TPR) repeat protein